MSNNTTCKNCGEVYEPSKKATNQVYCSSDCREAWWSWKKSKGVTQGDLNNRKSCLEIDLTLEQSAYIAGMIDGEGSVGVWRETRRGNKSGYRYKGVVEVYNTDTRVLHFLKDVCGGYIAKKRKASKKNKASWKWACTQTKISELLKQVRPYMILKGEQADIVLKFREIMDNAPRRASASHEHFEELYQMTKKLNRRGNHKL